MKKLFFFLIGIAATLGCFVLSSCSDEDKDVMSGVYGNVSDVSNNIGSCYNFINHNTLVYYPNATLSYVPQGKTIGESYWSSEWDGEVYTYTFEDNKIYIPQQGLKGVILTKSGDILIEDGSSKEFKKGMRPVVYVVD